MVQIVEMMPFAITSLLFSDLQASTEKRTFGQVCSLVDSQLPETDVFANRV